MWFNSTGFIWSLSSIFVISGQPILSTAIPGLNVRMPLPPSDSYPLLLPRRANETPMNLAKAVHIGRWSDPIPACSLSIVRSTRLVPRDTIIC
ncbi:hypothetical protein BJX96DRAFT_144428 [Aspergillus floccosus]